MNHPKNRIIVALDTDAPGRALGLVEALHPHVGSFKIGLEFINATLVRLITQEKPLALAELDDLRTLFSLIGDKLFWDGKLKDIPKTVAGASRPMTRLGVKMFNVHCMGGAAMMKEAVDAAESEKVASPTSSRPLILGVTLLTSLDYEALVELEIFPVLTHAEADMKKRRLQDRVFHLAMLAKTCGLDGVICSPQEIKGVRRFCGSDFKIVTPGIRSKDAPSDDQKRTMTPAEAIEDGANALVIGRPITQHKDPVDAAKRIADEIGDALASNKEVAAW